MTKAQIEVAIESLMQSCHKHLDKADEYAKTNSVWIANMTASMVCLAISDALRAVRGDMEQDLAQERRLQAGKSNS